MSKLLSNKDVEYTETFGNVTEMPREESLERWISSASYSVQ